MKCSTGNKRTHAINERRIVHERWKTDFFFVIEYIIDSIIFDILL